MAENEDGQEKTEEPTARRQQQAREDGTVITSKEAFVFMSIVIATLGAYFVEPLMRSARSGFAQYFVFDGGVGGTDTLLVDALGRATLQVVLVGVGFGAALLVATLLIQMAVGGLNFAPKAIGFKGSKLNPLSGLKRMVSTQALVELGKAILKVGLLVGASAQVLWSLMPRLSALWASEADAATTVLLQGVTGLLLVLSIALSIIAGADYAWQAFSHRKNLLMTKQEVKEDSKNSEGNPEIKGKMRQMQMQASRRSGRERASVEDVGQATAIITNPTHFAVALRYVPGEMPAPVIVSMAKGPMAQEIMRRGSKLGITVLQEPPLARALYFTGDIGVQIDFRLFAAVATVLAHIHRLDRGEESILPDIILPQDVRYDAHGRPERSEDNQ